MCRSIKTLHNFKPPASDEEIRASSLQFVRKLSGFTKPSKANEQAFARGVDAVARAARELIDSLITSAPPRNREVEAAKARERARRNGEDRRESLRSRLDRERLVPMDWMSAAVAAIAGAVGALIATALVGRWRDRPIAFVAVMVASFTAINVLSERFLLPELHRLSGVLEAERSWSREWTTVRIDESALSLSLPGPLTPRAVTLPPESEGSVSRFNVSTYEGDGLHIAVSHAIFKPGVAASVSNAIEGALNNLRQLSGGSLEETRRPRQVDGRPGFIVDLRMHGGREDLVGHSLFLTEGAELWQVLILYKPEQAAGESVSNTLIESARFDRPSPKAE